MSDAEATGTATNKRPTPWGVLVVAGIVFAIALWLYLGVRDEVRQNEEAARARATLSASADRPKILGRDILPQEAPAVSATSTPSGSSTPSASAAPAASASSTPSASAAPHTSAPGGAATAAAPGGPREAPR